ncbi:hypothetical protein HK405_002574, partial [Cladochytrium tenue]
MFATTHKDDAIVLAVGDRDSGRAGGGCNLPSADAVRKDSLLDIISSDVAAADLPLTHTLAGGAARHRGSDDDDSDSDQDVSVEALIL